MVIAKYLLDIEGFMDTEKGEALMKRASLCVDGERRRRAEGMRTPAGRAACLGAGVLLQFAVDEALEDGGCCFVGSAGAGVASDVGSMGAGVASDVGSMGAGTAFNVGSAGVGAASDVGLAGACGGLQIYSVAQLLERREDACPRQYCYRYGGQGKPYFADLPFYFNLSHSGSYVLCGLSMEEIGADIQQHCGREVGKLARRFYSEREAAVLEQVGEAREKLFYRLWARKEAYGKLTGEGVAGVLGVEMLPETVLGDGGEKSGAFSGCSQAMIYERMSLPDGRRLVWEEGGWLKGYSVAFCRYG